MTEAVKAHDLHIAGMPSVEPDDIKKGQDLKLVVSCEVYPEIVLSDMADVSIDKNVLSIEPSDIEDALSKVQKQHATWSDVDRAAAIGDQVDIDFEGFLNDVAFENGSSKHFVLELGAGQMIPGFEDGIVGQKPSELRENACCCG